MKIATCQSVYWNSFGYEPMQVEVDVSRGLFCFTIVGLADKGVHESRSRILAALKNCDFITPQRANHKVTVSLLPSHTKKVTQYADLAITVAYLSATEQVHIPDTEHIMCIGELGLDGTLSTQEDIIQIIHAAHAKGCTHFIFPKQATQHIHLLPGIFVYEIESLRDLEHIEFTPVTIKKTRVSVIHEDEFTTPFQVFEIDQLQGLHFQKRALMIALAGNHHLIFSGPPGSGKSALVRCAGELIDSLTVAEALASHKQQVCTDVRAFYQRPIRQPHHSITRARFIGGSISHQYNELLLAHHGILILDEVCEYRRETLESLREVMETHQLSVHNSQSTQYRDIRTTILSTTNSCPCGMNSKNIQQRIRCNCLPFEKKRYQKRLSEALIDRFQIRCTCAYSDHSPENQKHKIPFEHSGVYMKQLIQKTRDIQRSRNPDTKYNNELRTNHILDLGITSEAMAHIDTITHTFNLSKRMIHNTIKVARTIADLEQSPEINHLHILEAIGHTKNHPFE